MVKSKAAEENGAQEVAAEEDSYEDKLRFVSVIAKPMASKKLAKKVYKLIKKATKQKTFLRNGLKDVQGRIRKGETGYDIGEKVLTPNPNTISNVRPKMMKRGKLAVIRTLSVPSGLGGSFDNPEDPKTPTLNKQLTVEIKIESDAKCP